MCHKSGTRVHKHADEDGDHRKRDDIDMQHIVADHDGGDDREEDDQREQHGYRSDLLKIVVAEQCQVDHQAYHEDSDIQDLSHDGDADLLVVLVTTLQFLLVGGKDVVGVVVDDIAPVDDLLPTLAETAGQWDAVVQVAQTGFAALFVVAQVGRDVIVEVTLLQDLPMAVLLGVEAQLLIGRDR